MRKDVWDNIPESLDAFIGQSDVVENLKVTLKSAQIRKTLPDHVLLSGPPGLGKSTLVSILSKELNAPVIKVTGTKISTKDEAYNLINNIRVRPKVCVFIDEIHRLPRKFAEILYSVMQDSEIDGDQILGDFVIFGATTSEGAIDKPLKDRFKHFYTLDYYGDESIKEIIKSISPELDGTIAEQIATKSHGIPRLAKNRLTELLNTATVNGREIPNEYDLEKTLDRLRIDDLGLRKIERKIMTYIHLAGKPVGEKELCGVHELHQDDLIVSESILMRKNLITRTARGRTLTPNGIKHIRKFIDGD